MDYAWSVHVGRNSIHQTMPHNMLVLIFTPTPNSRQSPPCPQVFVSLMQLFNLWLCGSINLNIYRIVTVIFSEILPHATFGDPIQRKKGIVGFSPNYPFFLGIWSERKDSNLRLPAPKAGMPLDFFLAI